MLSILISCTCCLCLRTKMFSLLIFKCLMNLFHKIRCRLAKRRFEKALDNVTTAEFNRMCAMQNWFQNVRLVPGDRVVLTFNDHFVVEEISRENRHEDIMSNPNDFDL